MYILALIWTNDELVQRHISVTGPLWVKWNKTNHASINIEPFFEWTSHEQHWLISFDGCCTGYVMQKYSIPLKFQHHACHYNTFLLTPLPYSRKSTYTKSKLHLWSVGFVHIYCSGWYASILRKSIFFFYTSLPVFLRPECMTLQIKCLIAIKKGKIRWIFAIWMKFYSKFVHSHIGIWPKWP